MLNEDKEMICNKMNVMTADTHSKYLGLSVVFGRSKKVIFSLVVDRVCKKLKGWKEKFMSQGGKEVLIKVVAQAIPNYIMSYYKLLEGACHEIESLLAKFWSGSKEGQRKVHRISWDRLFMSKRSGGMGFRGFSNFNKALLEKHCWRLMNGGDSLLGRVFKSRYYPRSTFLEAQIGYQPSYTRRSMLGAKEVIEKRTCWRVGNEEHIKIWHDQCNMFYVKKTI
jgi:hypothetical protein